MATQKRFKARAGLDNNSQTIIGVADPVNAQDAATKAFSSNASNLTAGTLPAARLPAFTGDASVTAGTSTITLSNSGATAGTYKSVTVDNKGRVTSGTNPTTLAGYGITDAAAASHTHTIIGFSDTRSENFNPTSYQGLSLHLKENITDGLDDGSGYHGVLNLMPWTDYTGGRAHQLGFTHNGNMHIRSTADGTTFSPWGKVWTSLNDGAGSGLDADLLDGLSSASTNTASTVVTRDSSGNFSAGTITAALSGNASTATTLQTARTIATSGDVTGTATSFNGSANITIPLTLANTGVTAGTYKSVTVDAKGRITAGTNPTTLAGYGITDAQPKDATLTALGGVTTAADKIIYATAPDVFTTTSITPFARTLIDDVDAAAMRTTLGIDGLPILTFIGDTPPINPWNGVTWYCTDDGRTYVYYVDTDSSQWVESSPQSPATTDTIRGTNANGDYTKFADGTLICWISTTTSASTTKAITYPMAFVSAPVCTITAEGTTPCVATTQSPSATGISINGWNMNSARVAIVCKIMAVGSWK